MARLIKGFKRTLSLSKLSPHKKTEEAAPVLLDKLPEVPERFASPDHVEEEEYSPAIRAAYRLTFLSPEGEGEGGVEEVGELTRARLALLSVLGGMSGSAIVGATEMDAQVRGALGGLDSGEEEGGEGDMRVWGAYRRLVEVERRILAAEDGKEEGSAGSSVTCVSTPILTNPEQLPQPRQEVLRRLKLSESSRSLYLARPDIVRRGSANGFCVAELVMGGVQDHRFVLPYLHFVRHEEVRALKQWLVERDFVRQSGSISRIEKVLHCVQLLQTGMRYESIAVVFSRTPRQVMESCHEVLRGLEVLYEETVQQGCEGKVYEKLWGIARRYAIGQLGKVEKYYGFKWEEIRRILVALNVYIGRWRGTANPFDGRLFRWGSYLDVKEGGIPSIVAEESSDESDEDSAEIVELDMEDYNKRMSCGSSSLTSIDTASSSLYEEPVAQAAIAQRVWYRKL
ncbi:hypothetical protein HBI56_106620 [Parastagonospora nodorum]|uniref:Uncharacterized protein n=2 Tax=Phaeosphaeria nodorum (strain SN15 / ATCC MYA-4574 / FGSC 10173) TaxID=321614 RepID=Q0U9K9_PHANO|nr:hypothetical protein SNOG_11555 [Parastagonospora nodorum SN15]KAH3911245.1 hypothetical protein HBH56_132260 [Parastagonospora nodorum]EAT81263.1 hypothetical protein SNOG_11555 [Parastagonospora nodorum SN15]KAH3927070.1 hypothetical protein HBH54_160960 [Parastagonospora nodorum]KAH3995987.1 hypothetical protein HBI10_165460 [Parastagonospora nodorum]KAH4021731.1 hypothetical protein HBI13_106710 [Parastagonospora nodorum]